jgi:putative resolvase
MINISMRLSTWAEKEGISYITAWRWFKENKLPVKAIKTSSGTILIQDEDKFITSSVVIYCRVSSSEKKDDLTRQIERCKDFCSAKGYSVNNIYKEIASGMNDNRKELWRMIDSKPSIIVVENKDRLTRFGFNYIERLLKHLGCKIEILNPDCGDESDLIKDMISIVTSFCCRLYGARRGVNKRNRIKEVIDDQVN